MTSEYRALRDNTDKLISGTSSEYVKVAAKCFSKYLISEFNYDDQQSKETKAAKLVLQIIEKTSYSPDSFQLFLKVLSEVPSLEYLAELIKTDFDEKKSKTSAKVSSSTYKKKSVVVRPKDRKINYLTPGIATI